MSRAIATVAPQSRDLKVFRPQEAKLAIAKADAVADLARRMRDWPLLERAIDEKIEQQREFVEWWRGNVSAKGGRPSTKEKPAQNGAGFMMRDQAEDLTGIKHQQVSKWSTRLKREPEYRKQLFSAAYRAMMAEGGSGVIETLNTGDMEGYTPAEYIEAAREVMRGIDLDPATHERAQTTVQATQFYTAQDDGLSKEWRGTVFLNPPYNTGLIDRFIEKLIAELDAGRVTSAVMLTNNNTDTRWFHDAARKAAAICLTKGRIKFYKPDSTISAPTNGQAFFYFGDDIGAFAKRFGAIGLVMVKAPE